MIPVISPNYFMQKASYMQAELIADTIIYHAFMIFLAELAFKSDRLLGWTTFMKRLV